MESSVSTNLDSRASQLKQQTLPSRKRKVVERSVVRVKMGENFGKVKTNEGPPSDSWSWRKYGQKPIKGSPFPRGYYRCSTSKGCSAKKQVERCKTDASVLVITYTSTHNHPTYQNSKQNDQPLKAPKRTDTDEEEEEEEEEEEDAAAAAEEEQESEEMQGQGYEEMRKEEDQAILEATSHEGEEHYFHYIESPLRSHSVQDMMINQDMIMSTLEFVLDEEPINMISCSIHHNMITSPKSEGNDFFDELEELPTALPFTSFTRSNCFQETIPPVQS